MAAVRKFFVLATLIAFPVMALVWHFMTFREHSPRSEFAAFSREVDQKIYEMRQLDLAILSKKGEILMLESESEKIREQMEMSHKTEMR